MHKELKFHTIASNGANLATMLPALTCRKLRFDTKKILLISKNHMIMKVMNSSLFKLLTIIWQFKSLIYCQVL